MKGLIRWLHPLSGALFGSMVLLSMMVIFAPQSVAQLTSPKGLHLKAPYTSLEPTAVPSYAQAVERASPSIVSLYTFRTMAVQEMPQGDAFLRQFFPDNIIPPKQQDKNTPQEQPYGFGSGIIFTPEGHLLTNYHVIQDASRIEVHFDDDSTVDAKLLGADPDMDIAVLKIESDRPLHPIAIGSSESMKIGDMVLAIGYPFRVGKTVTHGILSAKDRDGTNYFQKFIQIDASVNRGNSGGAAIDIYGNLIGVNTMIISTAQSQASHGVNFAVPIDTVMPIVEDLITSGHVARGWLGIHAQALNETLKTQLDYQGKEGVVVVGVIHQGPAFLAGIRPGDIITAINGKAIIEQRDILKHVADMPPHKPCPITVYRHGQHEDILVHVGQRPNGLEKVAGQR